MPQGLKQRIAWFFATLAAGSLFMSRYAERLLGSQNADLYSHIPFIYGVALYFVFKNRKEIFGDPSYAYVPGGALAALSLAVYLAGYLNRTALSSNNLLSVMFTAWVVFLLAMFLMFFGTAAFRKACFPAALLFLTIPIPDFVLERVVYFLQYLSYSVTCWIFDLLHYYPLKEGFVLTFPEVTISVAKQCSGIRSSLALLIVSILCGYSYLRTYTGRILLVVLTIFIAPFKNGLRITTLTLLGIHWDKKVFSGALHTAGGLPFFLIGLAWLSLLVLLTSRMEKILAGRTPRQPAGIR